MCVCMYVIYIYKYICVCVYIYIYKTARGKKRPVTYRGTKIRLTDLSSETMQMRRQWSDIFKILGVKVHSEFHMWEKYFSKQQQGNIKTFADVQNLKGFITGTTEK